MPHQSSTFVSRDEPKQTHQYHPKSMVYLRVHSLCCIFYCFDKCIVTCIRDYSIIQNSVTALKFSYASLFLPSSLPKSLVTTDLFIVFIVLPFPECHIVGIIQYVAFSDYFLLLNVLVCLHCYNNNNNTLKWVACKQQIFISHSSGGWEVQDPGVWRSGVW